MLIHEIRAKVNHNDIINAHEMAITIVLEKTEIPSQIRIIK